MPLLRQLRCPNCGAALSPQAGATLISCPYCDTESAIEGKQPIQAGHGQMVARYAYPKWIWFVYLVPVALMAGGVLVTMGLHRGGSGLGASSLLDWRSIGWPMVADVNGDGTDDILGWLIDINTSAGSTTDMMAAFDGRDGSRLWMSDALGENVSITSTSAVVGDAIIVVDESGKARALSLKDGLPRWQTSLGERAETVCASAGEAGAVITLADKRTVLVATSDGAMRPIAEAQCAPTSSTKGMPAPQSTGISAEAGSRNSGSSDLAPDGMNPSTVLRDPGNKWLVLLGTKNPGTSIPMVAAYRCAAIHSKENEPWGPKYECQDPELVFKSLVPSGDPLQAAVGAPAVATVAAGVVYVGYEPTSGTEVHHVTAFELSSGRRLFDVPGLLAPETVRVKHDLKCLVPTNAGLVVDHGYGGLSMIDDKTGQPKFTIAR